LREPIGATQARITNDPLPVVMGDIPQLTQLLQNLLSNSIKYRSERPIEIHVSAEELPLSWRIRVRDNGIGIDKAYWERIFVIFQRLHTRQEYPGTGIGLAICKKIVERHGGRIWVESRPGEGSTFCFELQKPTNSELGGNRCPTSKRSENIASC
jgi:light-regulated signal transduction histidine kinase (bacteriophytochrome)